MTGRYSIYSAISTPFLPVAVRGVACETGQCVEKREFPSASLSQNPIKIRILLGLYGLVRARVHSELLSKMTIQRVSGKLDGLLFQAGHKTTRGNCPTHKRQNKKLPSEVIDTIDGIVTALVS